MHRRLSRSALAGCVAALFVFLAGPGFASPAVEEPAGDRIAVVATTNIIADIVARVGGDRIALSVMLPLGADPHVFQPTPRDVRLMADAAVVFANGAGLETEFLGDLIANAGPRRVVELSEHLPLRRMADAHGVHGEHDEDDGHEAGDEHDGDEHDEHGEDDEHDAHDEDGDQDDEHEHGDEDEHADESGDGHAHGEFDPHVWMDPTLVAGWAAEVAEVLAEIDPEHAAAYERRAAELVQELHELDAWIADRVAAVPDHRRVIVTDHEVLGYFADRYGFELLDAIVPGSSTASEPSARHLAELRDLIEEHEVPAIFVGTTVSPQVAEVVAADLGIKVVTIYTGSLSEPGGPAATYREFMRTNVERIVTALTRP